MAVPKEPPPKTTTCTDTMQTVQTIMVTVILLASTEGILRSTEH